MTTFHKGEVAIQKQLGVDKIMAEFGSKVVRDHMPQQHMDFYQNLTYLFAGYSDQQGDVWASILTSESGIADTPDDKHMLLKTMPVQGDPLYDLLKNDIKFRLGLLGVDLTNRRRNRLSAGVSNVNEKGILLDILQSFGNCPQYIQTRVKQGASRTAVTEVKKFTSLDEDMIRLIRESDTFFVASASQQASEVDAGREEGADVSHRGGQPGFVKVAEDGTLTIPDYMGNNHFNTLGNFLVNPSAGLLFIDFETGSLLSLTGTAEILWDSPEQEFFKGAERLWTFRLKKGVWIKNALPFKWEFNEASPNSLMTGTWDEASVLEKAMAEKSAWHQYEIASKVAESARVMSLYLKPLNGVKATYNAGGFTPLRVTINGQQHIRTYSLSSSPHEEFLRISVKREENGLVSNYIHNELNVGDTLELNQPNSEFAFDVDSDKPAVLISAGIGITPMMSMLKHASLEGFRTRNKRPVIMLNSFADKSQKVFEEEINQFSERFPENYIFWFLTREEDVELEANELAGRLSRRALQKILPIDDYEFFLCGPGSFMQDVYDMLLDLGVDDKMIQAESFGPSALKRQLQDTKPTEEVIVETAENAVVRFTNSDVELQWDKKDGDLLSFAESHLVTPPYSCRSGNCGSCKTKVVSGSVIHTNPNHFPIAEDEALLCCAMPAVSKDEQIPILVLH